MVDEHREAGGTGESDPADERQRERAALDDIEASLVDVAAVLARMG